ncbi:MAG: dioxygenase [Thermoguttaceae bacterium]|jgi:enamine deaminase RidA (YjgF/YER057c/UK114 family)
MATHTIRKSSQAGIGYSAVDLNDVRHVFAAAVPRRGLTLRQQADDALRTIEAVIQEQGTRGSIVHQAVFVPNVNLIDECRQIIHDFYGKELPATSYIPQPPCEGKLLAIEALGIGRGLGEVEIERVSEQLVIARHNHISWCHCAEVVPQNGKGDGSVYDASLDAFQQIRTLLGSVNIRLDQVIRTWLYLGGIVEDEGPTQRYKELNRARTDFFEDIHFLTDRLPPSRNGRVFPASTGIGTEGRRVMMSAIALATDRKDIVAVPLENPRQTSAFDYAEHYSPKTPKFSRAMALSCGNYATILVSGTASITNSETRHVGDAVAQTHETLDNIGALISEDNLCHHGLPGLGASLEGLGLVRVYIKRAEDYANVRAACEKRLGELPTIYAMADVCRPDLLVEIEGIAFSHRSPTPLPAGNSPHFHKVSADEPSHFGGASR